MKNSLKLFKVTSWFKSSVQLGVLTLTLGVLGNTLALSAAYAAPDAQSNQPSSNQTQAKSRLALAKYSSSGSDTSSVEHNQKNGSAQASNSAGEDGSTDAYSTAADVPVKPVLTRGDMNKAGKYLDGKDDQKLVAGKGVFDLGNSKHINYKRFIINVKLGFGFYNFGHGDNQIFGVNDNSIISVSRNSKPIENWDYLDGSIELNPMYANEFLRNVYISVHTSSDNNADYQSQAIVPVIDYHLIYWFNPKENTNRVELYGGGGVGFNGNEYQQTIKDDKNIVVGFDRVFSFGASFMLNLGAQYVYRHFVVFTEYQHRYDNVSIKSIVNKGGKRDTTRTTRVLLMGFGLSV